MGTGPHINMSLRFLGSNWKSTISGSVRKYATVLNPMEKRRLKGNSTFQSELFAAVANGEAYAFSSEFVAVVEHE